MHQPHSKLALCLLPLLPLLSSLAPSQGVPGAESFVATPLVPQPRANNQRWNAVHQGLVAQAASLSPADVAFYGDSITEGWLGLFMGKRSARGRKNSAVFTSLGTRLGSPVKAFGIAGDTVPNLMWRLQNGESPRSPSPGVSVINIGVNDILKGVKPRTVALNVIQLCRWYARMNPRTRVILLGLHPESSGNGSVIPDTRPTLANAWIRRYLRILPASKQIQYLDCQALLTDANGSLYPDNYIDDSSKYLHFSAKGYSTISTCVQPAISALLLRPQVAPQTQRQASGLAKVRVNGLNRPTSKVQARPITSNQALTARPLAVQHRG